MQVHRLKCHHCGGMDVRNFIVRESGKTTRVFVSCCGCFQFVGSYQVKSCYHHGDGVESYLKEHGVGAGDSGRQWLADFEDLKKEAVQSYADAIQRLYEAGKLSEDELAD